MESQAESKMQRVAQTATSSCPQLPAEIWLLIFAALPYRSFRTARRLQHLIEGLDVLSIAAAAIQQAWSRSLVKGRRVPIWWKRAGTYRALHGSLRNIYFPRQAGQYYDDDSFIAISKPEPLRLGAWLIELTIDRDSAMIPDAFSIGVFPTGVVRASKVEWGFLNAMDAAIDDRRAVEIYKEELEREMFSRNWLHPPRRPNGSRKYVAAVQFVNSGGSQDGTLNGKFDAEAPNPECHISLGIPNTDFRIENTWSGGAGATVKRFDSYVVIVRARNAGIHVRFHSNYRCNDDGKVLNVWSPNVWS